MVASEFLMEKYTERSERLQSLFQNVAKNIADVPKYSAEFGGIGGSDVEW